MSYQLARRVFEKDKVFAPIPGVVKAILVQQGEQVEKNTVLLILEAMKMENEITATETGIIKAIYVELNQSVLTNDILMEFE